MDVTNTAGVPTETPPDVPLLSVGEVARRLHVSPRTVHRLLALGELPYVQVVGRRRRVHPDDLACFIADRTRRAVDQ